MVTESTVACRCCGEQTGYVGTGLCDPCWKLREALTHLMHLVRADRSENACKWLVNVLRGKRPDGGA